MRGEIVSDQHEPNRDYRNADELGDKLDSAIGETSSGIGAMFSELIRRSLKSGVSDIGKSLHSFAEEKVEQAVERQMPVITEAADAVAESTSKRIVKSFVDDWSEKSEKQRIEIETKIQTVEASAVDRSRAHLDEVFTRVQQTISETQDQASQQHNASEQRLEEIQQRARRTWKKIKEELETLRRSNRKSHEDLEGLSRLHDGLQQQHVELEQTYARLNNESVTLRGQLELVQRHAEEQVKIIGLLQSQQESILGRLDKLEQPKGLRALFAKMGGSSKKKSTDPVDGAEGHGAEGHGAEGHGAEGHAQPES